MMELLLRSLLLGLLTVAPVGAGQISMCDLGYFVHFNPHHHDDALNPHAVCTDTGASHHHEEPAPCSDNCSLILFDAAQIRYITVTPISAPKALTACISAAAFDATPSGQHRLALSKDPPSRRAFSRSPEQLCRFLN